MDTWQRENSELNTECQDHRRHLVSAASDTAVKQDVIISWIEETITKTEISVCGDGVSDREADWKG